MFLEKKDIKIKIVVGNFWIRLSDILADDSANFLSYFPFE